ncbi:hypothetical protein [Maribacter arenosus]|uniref:Uncharacterized protein n=1 Tax=Maribacter arenosus TaxID=1854708 RepID=A0ABR7VBE6_9FLAO|nr:hypothetical protein [Maribacter arenosus]MBD0850216.1 hypothetical protein [Maribacter arenosus]
MKCIVCGKPREFIPKVKNDSKIEPGEAIYDTDAWYTFGEGPTKEPEGHFKNHKAFMKLKYSNTDIRYTTKDYLIDAIDFGAVEPGKEVGFESFAKDKIYDALTIGKGSFLGSDEKIDWSNGKEKGLSVKAPTKTINEMAIVIKLTILQ